MSTLTTLAVTVTLLTISNIFMTLAWYGHLKHKYASLWLVVLVSWLIAFAEYCFQVPANRIGSTRFSFAQLKVMQEIITLTVFAGFMAWYFGEKLRWTHGLAFALLVGAAMLIFRDFEPAAPEPTPARSSPDDKSQEQRATNKEPRTATAERFEPKA